MCCVYHIYSAGLVFAPCRWPIQGSQPAAPPRCLGVPTARPRDTPLNLGFLNYIAALGHLIIGRPKIFSDSLSIPNTFTSHLQLSCRHRTSRTLNSSGRDDATTVGMSKQHAMGDFDEDLPPPYTESAHENYFSSHLSNLHNAVSSQPQTDNDTHILSLLVDPIDNFINQASDLRPASKTVEGTFVPEEAVSSEWRLTDEGEQHRGECTKVIRVSTKQTDSKCSKEKSWGSAQAESSSGKEFDDWGRWDEPSSSADTEEALWWADEDLAMRLAKHIQPTSLRGMNVRADHVTFRRENEMGIWESKSGWAIVVRLQLR